MNSNRIMEERIIYSLNVEDVQTVATELLERHLLEKEVEMLEDAIAERIDWFGAIADAISAKVGKSVNNK